MKKLYSIALLALFIFSTGNLLGSESSSLSVDPSVIKNIAAESEVEGFNVSWSLDYAFYEQLKNEGYTISLEYNTKIGAKRFKNGYQEAAWQEIHGIPIDQTNYEINALVVTKVTYIK